MEGICLKKSNFTVFSYISQISRPRKKITDFTASADTCPNYAQQLLISPHIDLNKKQKLRSWLASPQVIITIVLHFKKGKNISCFLLITGLALSFFSGVYGASIGFTNAIGKSAKQLVGLNGVFLGVGEVLGGVAFGLLGKRSSKWGRDPIVITGFIIHIISYFLVFMNLPDVAVFGDTDEIAYFNPPIPSVAMLCSFLLGLGDACYNTQIYSMLGGVFAKSSAEAFSIFKFSQVCFNHYFVVTI